MDREDLIAVVDARRSAVSAMMHQLAREQRLLDEVRRALRAGMIEPAVARAQLESWGVVLPTRAA